MNDKQRQAQFNSPGEKLLEVTGRILATMKHDRRIHSSRFMSLRDARYNHSILIRAMAGHFGAIGPKNKERIARALDTVNDLIKQKTIEPRCPEESKQRGFTFNNGSGL